MLAISPDGTRLADDRCGSGSAILLLHGGGGSRQEWRQAGYVQRLQEQFTFSLPSRRAARVIAEKTI